MSAVKHATVWVTKYAAVFVDARTNTGAVVYAQLKGVTHVVVVA